MKKSSFLKLLITLSLIYLVFQFVIFRIFKPSDSISKGSKLVKISVNKTFAGDKDSVIGKLLWDFNRWCWEFNAPVFLIDSSLLKTLFADKYLGNGVPESNHSSEVTSVPLITFGVINTRWSNQQLLLKALQRQGLYTTIVTSQRFSRDQQTEDKQKIATHYFFYQGAAAVIHIVVFFPRSGGVLWHSAVKISDLPRAFPLDMEQLQFGRHEGVFDRFDIEEVYHNKESVYIPAPLSTFLHQVPHSRHIECNQTRAELFYSQYGRDLSEEGFKFQRKARQIVARAKQLLDDLGIRFWLSSGTCLGWFRQCDIITYSQDVDLGIWIKDYKEEIIPMFEKGGFFLKHVFGKVSDSYELSFQAGDIKLDLFFFYEEGGTMWNGGTEYRNGQKYKYIFPEFTLCWTIFLDLKIRVPCETEAYIKANYGEDWFVPVKHWDWDKSPPNVRKNGFWPESEWDTVIQVY